MVLRGTAVLLIFLTVVPAHGIATLVGRRDLVPPLFLRWIGRACGLRVRSTGQVRPGALLLGNHVSWLDILALAGDCRAMFVAHSGLAGHGLLKWLCDQNATVFITRHKRGSVLDQVRQVRDALHRHRPLVIFPEGTTGDGLTLRPFKSALLSAVEPVSHQVPVQPVALHFADAGTIAWQDGEPGLANARRILRRRGRIDLTIHYCAPLADADLQDRKTMAAAAQGAISAALRL